MRRLKIEFHYKTICPYCARVEKYVLNPLEDEGFISVRKINIDFHMNTPEIAENVRLHVALGYPPRPGAPLIIDKETGDYFALYQDYPGEPISSVLKDFARNFVNHVCKRLDLPPSVVARNALIQKCLRGEVL